MEAFVVRQMATIHAIGLMCSANSLSLWCVQQVSRLLRCTCAFTTQINKFFLSVNNIGLKYFTF